MGWVGTPVQHAVALSAIHCLERVNCDTVDDTLTGRRWLTQDGDLFPPVAVQVPVCNEREVIGDTMDCMAALRWPRSRLLIQARTAPRPSVHAPATCAAPRTQVTRGRTQGKLL